MANIAKFISECAFLIHYNCWQKLSTWRDRRKDIGIHELRPFLDDNDDEQVLNLNFSFLNLMKANCEMIQSFVKILVTWSFLKIKCYPIF